MIGMFFTPDSPKYLLSEGKTSDAQKSLQWLRGGSTNVEPELRTLSKSIEEERQIGNITFKQLFTERAYLHPFMIAMFAHIGQQFCGVNVVIFYLQTIFEKSHSSLDPSKLFSFATVENTSMNPKYFIPMYWTSF